MNTLTKDKLFAFSSIVIAATILLVAMARTSRAQGDSISVTWNGFVDTYFMYDFNSPGGTQKSHPFTQPARHNEFNVNLAHIQVQLNSPDVRGVLALHTGTAVQLNYAAEATSNVLAPLIHQAWVGYRIAEGLWVDAGVYPAPYGFEGWMSRDNKTYTRSIVADYSPYYQTGVKLSWAPSDVFNGAIHVINGWQNMAETNTDKAVGISLGWVPSETINFTYNNFIGNESPTGIPAATRFYNNLLTRITLSDDFQIDLTTDYGMQSGDSIDASWVGVALIGRYQFSEKLAVALRGEYYADEDQVILVTGTPNGFDGFGASLNFDVALTSQLLWRTEVRILNAQDPIFPAKDGMEKQSGFVVSSFAITM